MTVVFGLFFGLQLKLGWNLKKIFFIKLKSPFKNPGSATDKVCFVLMLLLFCGYVKSNCQACSKEI